MHDDSAPGRLTNSAKWRSALPDNLYRGLAEWIKSQPFALTYRRSITGGLSGSFVVFVHLHAPGDGLVGAILKIVPREIATTESQAVRLAAIAGPEDFVVKHLVKSLAVESLPGEHGAWVHLQELAYVEAAEVVPLSERTDDSQLAAYCERIVRSLVTEWNVGDSGPTPETSIARFLQQDLGAKVRGLEDFGRSMGLLESAATVTFGDGDQLPNPLALMRDASVATPDLVVFRGRGHGDLHVDNVLVPVVDGAVAADGFKLIDYGRFSERLPISRDPAKLLLSIAAGWLVDLAAGSTLRPELARLTVAPDEYESTSRVDHYAAVARGIWSAASEWGARRRVEDDWQRQHLLVLAGSALRTAARSDVTPDDRHWHFMVSALALDRLQRDRRRLPTKPRRPGEGSPSAQSPGKYTKLEFCRRLGPSWKDLSDVLGIQSFETASFPPGDEPRAIWEWLEVRKDLAALRPALRVIGRLDLDDIF